MQVSVIISFYNKISWLKLLLAGFARQSMTNFEVIIADDGSNEHIIKELKNIRKNYPFPIKHQWHEDKGWQKNIILNKATLATKSEYIIFVDGDCIPHRHFVKEHFNNRRKNTVLAGRRLHLSPSVTHRLTAKTVKEGYLEFTGMLKLFYDRMRGNGGEHWENGIYAPKWIRSFINRKHKGIVGSNFSIFKSDLLAVNGFDERYLAPAIGEDTDLELRLKNLKCKIKSIKHLAIQYHLHHKTLNRPSKNIAIFESNKAQNIIFTPYGIKKKNTPIALYKE